MSRREEIREGLTKQEWVQKYLEDILGDAWRKGVDGKGIDVTEEAEKARLHLTKWGCVLRVDSRNMNRFNDDKGKWHTLVEVEPLIKEN